MPLLNINYHLRSVMASLTPATSPISFTVSETELAPVVQPGAELLGGGTGILLLQKDRPVPLYQARSCLVEN